MYLNIKRYLLEKYILEKDLSTILCFEGENPQRSKKFADKDVQRICAKNLKHPVYMLKRQISIAFILMRTIL